MKVEEYTTLNSYGQQIACEPAAYPVATKRVRESPS
jgi:hypothetical protein